jgi:transcriptional regulator with XRE-family HTH domain
MEVNGAFQMPFTLVSVMARIGAEETDSTKAWHLALGQRVGAIQVVISDYENGKSRLFAETAVRFAAALDVPVQELLQVSKPVAVEPAHKPSRKLLRRMEQIERLPRRKQTALLTTIDTFLEKSPAS